ALAVPAEGQSHAEHEVIVAVEQIFEGMRTANPALVRAVFAPDARFAMVGGDADGVAVQSVEGWLSAIGTSERRWDERIYDVEVRLDGVMASAWVPYTFYLDGAVRHCGINSIELLRDDSGWKVTQISDTRRTEGCPDPLGG
ncbi:MAG: nuclear transport factor 2 family protein, partial [Thioalkalivibrio sp.]|nr:nuclear transport factor 2 family protein [Thioalkalivibrio sp.]